ESELVAWLIEVHLLMSSVAQSRDLSDRVTIENFSKVMQSVERMKLLAILTAADIKAVGPGVWNSWKAQLIRTLYYDTEPVPIAGACAVAGGNGVDGQVFTATDVRALDTIAVWREFVRDEDEARRAAGITQTSKRALGGSLRLPEVVAKRAGNKARLRVFALEP